MSQEQTFSLRLSEFCRDKQTEVSRVRCDAAVCEKERQKEEMELKGHRYMKRQRNSEY